MATEGQLNALQNWLGVKLEDIDFDSASEYLDRLHEASEQFNTDKTKKGIVKKTKQAICDELRKAGKIKRPEGEEKLIGEKAGWEYKEEETVKDMKGPEDAAHDEEGFPQDETPQQRQARQDRAIEESHAQVEIRHMAVVLRFCVRDASGIVEEEVGTGVSESVRANLMQKFATTLFIEASRRGL